MSEPIRFRARMGSRKHWTRATRYSSVFCARSRTAWAVRSSAAPVPSWRARAAWEGQASLPFMSFISTTRAVPPAEAAIWAAAPLRSWAGVTVATPMTS